jgi:hypothetical protein
MEGIDVHSVAGFEPYDTRLNECTTDRQATEATVEYPDHPKRRSTGGEEFFRRHFSLNRRPNGANQISLRQGPAHW